MRTLQRKLARRDNDVIKMERELHKLRVRASTCIFIFLVHVLLLYVQPVWHTSYWIQHCFICRPSDSTCGRLHGIEPWTGLWLWEFLTTRLNAKSKLLIIHTRLHFIHIKLHHNHDSNS